MTSLEHLVASIAMVRFFIVVHGLVAFQLVRVGEGRLANFAFVWFLARVDSHVSPQIGDLHKVSITVVTVIRFLASVKTHMGFQVVVSRESFMALWALKRLFAGVCSFVVLQNMFVAE